MTDPKDLTPEQVRKLKIVVPGIWLTADEIEAIGVVAINAQLDRLADLLERQADVMPRTLPITMASGMMTDPAMVAAALAGKETR